MNGECPDHLYSTIFTLKDRPGILLEALKPFAVSYYYYSLNMFGYKDVSLYSQVAYYELAV